MKSNLKINSNVYIRKRGIALAEDREFLSKVRGVKAVRKLLWLAFEIDPGVSFDDQKVRWLVKQDRLTPAQWNSLKWGIFCHLCETIPEGQTFDGTVEFRCNEKDCK